MSAVETSRAGADADGNRRSPHPEPVGRTAGADVAAGSRRGKPKLLVIGPTPPPHHGVAVYTEQLLGEPVLRSRLQVVHLDSADRRSLDNLGRLDWRNVTLAMEHTARLWRMLARERPDVVYLPISRNRWAYLRDAVLIASARLWRCRVITHLHGSDLRFFVEGSSSPWRTLVRWSSRRLTVAIVLSARHRSQYDGLVAPGRVTVVPAAIRDPFPAGPPRRAGSDGEPVTVVYLGTLYGPKGYDDLLRAAAQLRDRGLSLRFELAGPWASAQERPRGAALVEELGIRHLVRFPGVVEGESKRALLRRADILVFPGRQPEGLPLVVLEAMAAGLPVVATRTGALPDAVIDNETGRLVDPGQPAELADRISALAADRAERLRLGAAGRRLFLEKYTMEGAANALTALVEAACAS